MKTYFEAWTARLKILAEKHCMKLEREDDKDEEKFYIIDKNYGVLVCVFLVIFSFKILKENAFRIFKNIYFDML